MAKKPPSKADLRAELERETRRYLSGGGKVSVIPRGTTGTDPLKPGRSQWRSEALPPRASRTYVPEVVAAIEARRRKGSKKHLVRKRSLPRPRRKTLYDDFGEPIRRVWVED